MTSAMDQTGAPDPPKMESTSEAPTTTGPWATSPGANADPQATSTPTIAQASPASSGPVHIGVPRVRVTPLSIVSALIILVGAWAGIVAFVGPSFRFSADGTVSWTWNLAHALLGLAPGAAAVLAGLWMLAAVPHMAYERRRPLMGLAGLLAIAAGAWLVIGPFTWPVLEGHGYFFAAGWGLMLRQIGFSLGPGLVIAVGGAYALGWASKAVSPMGRPASEPAAALAPERATVSAA